MQKYTLTHVSDAVLLRDLAALVSRDRATTAELLAHVAEVDVRRLYAPAGYSSMFVYCVEELRLSEDAAYKRIRAARAGRRFPALLAAIEQGRLHLAAAYLLAPHLTPENANELIESASFRRKSDIEELLARRFPNAGPAIPARPVASIRPIPQPAPQLAPGPVECKVAARVESSEGEVGCAGALISSAPAHGRADGPNDKPVLTMAPPSSSEAPPLPQRFLLQVAIAKSTHEKLQRTQELLSHVVPSGDVAQVLDRALDVLLERLEKRKIGAGSRAKRAPVSKHSHRRPGKNAGERTRYIPVHVRRAVWERDQGQCTFVSRGGHRCGECRFLQFDHVEPVARGGTATVNGIRLRCRAHNQFEAERIFGAGFMEEKRRMARGSGRAEQTRIPGRRTWAQARDR